jgi:DNA-directed RNA polymerase I, II, and III subunit RPABC2
MADDDDFEDLPQDTDFGIDVDVIAPNEDLPKDDPLAALLKHHPECIVDYAEKIAPRIPLIASPPMNIDPNHTSVPFLTQYERTKIIGMRANQLSQGARPYVTVPEYMTDVGEIARLELKERRLPFLVRRPMPDGSHEYWRLSDLIIF